MAAVHTHRSAWLRAALVVGAGLGTGVLTLLGQSVLPTGWSQAAFLADAGFHALVLSEPPVGSGFAIAGMIVPVALGRSAEERIGG